VAETNIDKTPNFLNQFPNLIVYNQTCIVLRQASANELAALIAVIQTNPASIKNLAFIGPALKPIYLEELASAMSGNTKITRVTIGNARILGSKNKTNERAIATIEAEVRKNQASAINPISKLRTMLVSNSLFQAVASNDTEVTRPKEVIKQ